MIELPIPSTLLQITWLLIGFTFGRAFGKNLDQSFKASDFYKNQNLTVQWLISGLLDFLHHFWVGLLLMVYAGQVTALLPIEADALTFFGLGLFIDDLPDVPRRFQKYFKGLTEYLQPETEAAP
jgi:hypothetical protein